MILLLHKLKIFCILFRGKKKTLCILCGFATSLHSKLSNPVILYPLFHLLFLISISLNELTNKWLGQWHCTCRSPMGNPFICFMKNQIIMKVVLAQVLCGVHSWSYQFKACQFLKKPEHALSWCPGSHLSKRCEFPPLPH